MKLILDIATATRIASKPSLGLPSVKFGEFLPGSLCRATSGLRLQSLPPANRVRSIARILRAGAPAPGPGGILNGRTSRLEEANREWFNWRFGEDA
jgi:hypothetical protein